jgi:hypothetical protein
MRMIFAHPSQAETIWAMVAFWAGFSVEQKNVVRRYLIGARRMLDGAVHLSELHFIDKAQAIWGS